jgi:hypothetical protein
VRKYEPPSAPKNAGFRKSRPFCCYSEGFVGDYYLVCRKSGSLSNPCLDTFPYSKSDINGNKYFSVRQIGETSTSVPILNGDLDKYSLYANTNFLDIVFKSFWGLDIGLKSLNLEKLFFLFDFFKAGPSVEYNAPSQNISAGAHFRDLIPLDFLLFNTNVIFSASLVSGGPMNMSFDANLRGFLFRSKKNAELEKRNFYFAGEIGISYDPALINNIGVKFKISLDNIPGPLNFLFEGSAYFWNAGRIFI